MQVQLSVIYLATVWEKLQGARWRDGTAVSYALRIDDVRRFPTPGFLADSVVLSEVLTFGTLLLELSLAVLVWNRTLRPWVLALGVSLHLSIEFSMMVGFFSLLMLTTYLTFLPTEKARDLVLSARRRLRRRPEGASPPTGRAERSHPGTPARRGGARTVSAGDSASATPPGRPTLDARQLTVGRSAEPRRGHARGSPQLAAAQSPGWSWQYGVAPGKRARWSATQRYARSCRPELAR